MRRRTVALVAFAVLLVNAPPASASQAELERARRRANAAAADWATSEARLSKVQGQLADLEARTEVTRSALAELEGAMRSVAVNRFMRAGQRSSGPSEVDVADATTTTRAAVLSRLVTSESTDAVDAYRAVAEDLASAEEQLTAAREEAAALRERAKRDAATTATELKRLERLEAERIAREKAARERAERAEQERRRRAAAAAARPAAATAAAPAAPGRAPAPAPKPAAPSSRGQVMGGGGEWVCPVQGPRAFSNDYGDPRGGGRRRHQGNDILSPRGTPVVSPVAGTARRHDSGLGGKSFYVRGDDGNTYFGTHLDSYSDNYGRVAAGTVLGTVGTTGNASGGPPHLHFEIHPGGGGPVNPYPTLRQYC